MKLKKLALGRIIDGLLSDNWAFTEIGKTILLLLFCMILSGSWIFIYLGISNMNNEAHLSFQFYLFIVSLKQTTKEYLTK